MKNTQTETIQRFIIKNFLFGDASALQNDISFLESGVIDSTGMLELITFLESTFGIRIEPEEMVPENLDSVSKVVSFIQRKTAAGEAAR